MEILRISTGIISSIKETFMDLHSPAVEKVTPFKVMSVMQRALELEKLGRKIVHMEVGEPDFNTAQPIIDAAKTALDDGHTHYTSAAGLQALRDAISASYLKAHNLDIDPRRILVTPGASGGLTLLASLLVAAGDGILIPDPAYPCVKNFIYLMNAQPQLMPVTLEQNFQPTVEDFKGHLKANTSGLWLASPSNPTGTILSREELSAASEWAKSNHLHLLVDEIYHGLHYVDKLPTTLEIDESAYVVNSFSKYYGMTGWRLGWIVVPIDAIPAATKLAQNLYISASSIAQYAALAAFTEPAQLIFEERRREFKRRKDFLSESLASMGFKLANDIQGAFYIYADISKFSSDSEKFCHDLIENFGVAVTPGTDFGEFRSKDFVRFAFTTSMSDLEIGVERIRQFVA